jgi:site-specific recombinase XerD
MESLGLIKNQREITGIISKLEESIVDHLSKRGKKQPLSTNTRETYKAAIRDYNQFLREKRLHVSEESLNLYFDEIKDKYRGRTLNLRKSALKKVIKAQLGADSILNHMAIDQAFEKIESYQTETRISYDECLSEEQVEQLLITAPKKTRLIIYLLFKTACRVSEMINIRLSDCKPINGRVKIRIRGKGNKERDVRISTELYNAIRKTYPGKKWLFETKSGKQLNRSNVGRQVRNVGRMVGRLSVSPHTLRHSRETDMHVDKGI